MKRTWNSIENADVSKIKMRSKKEIIDKIIELEERYNKSDKKRKELEEEERWWLASWYEIELEDISRTTKILDWVLNIN